MLKKISKLSFINGLAQITTIVGFSINSKLYGAEIIGGLFVVLSYSSIVTVISSGYLEQAFFVEKNEGIHKYILVLILYLTLFTCIITGVFLAVTRIPYVWYIIMNIFSGTLLKTITSYNISKDRITFISVSKLFFSPIIPLLYFLSYHYNGAYEDLIIKISAVSNLVFSVFITIITLKILKVKLFLKDILKFKFFLSLFMRYIKFTKFSMTGEFMRTFAFRAPTIVLEKYFGKDIAGFYGVANTILLMPINVFLGTITQIYIQKISSFKKENQAMHDFTKKLLKLLLVLTIVGLGFYFLVGKCVIVLLLGTEFEPVYFVIIALLPYAVSIVIYNPIFSVYSVFEKQEFLFRMKLFVFVSSIISFSISVFISNFIAGLACFSISLFFIYTYYYLKSINIIRLYDKEIS